MIFLGMFYCLRMFKTRKVSNKYTPLSNNLTGIEIYMFCKLLLFSLLSFWHAI